MVIWFCGRNTGEFNTRGGFVKWHKMGVVAEAEWMRQQQQHQQHFENWDLSREKTRLQGKKKREKRKFFVVLLKQILFIF